MAINQDENANIIFLKIHNQTTIFAYVWTLLHHSQALRLTIIKQVIPNAWNWKHYLCGEKLQRATMKSNQNMEMPIKDSVKEDGFKIWTCCCYTQFGMVIGQPNAMPLLAMLRTVSYCSVLFSTRFQRSIFFQFHYISAETKQNTQKLHSRNRCRSRTPHHYPHSHLEEYFVCDDYE
jgi:hypothetical protein